jgi:short-subunit dehydrogenase
MNILITGATSGIGRQLAIDYLAAGHRVWAVGRNQQQLQELETLGAQAGAVDLLDREATLAWFATLERIDLAILSAGSCEYIDLPDFDSALLARVMRINVETMAHCIEGVLPALRRSEAYGASKAAVAYLIETLRLTLFAEGIAVSLVCPGFVKTPLTDRNDFPMPFLVSPEQASRAIRDGIAAKKAEIHFPKRFTLLMKAASLLPRSIWLRLAQRMRKR